MLKAKKGYLIFMRILMLIGLFAFLLVDLYYLFHGAIKAIDIFSIILCLIMMIQVEFMYRYVMKCIISIEIDGEKVILKRLNKDVIKLKVEDVERVIFTLNGEQIYTKEKKKYRILLALTQVEIRNGTNYHKGICEYDFPYAVFDRRNTTWI